MISIQPKGSSHINPSLKYILIIISVFSFLAIPNMCGITYGEEEPFYSIQLGSYKEVEIAKERVKDLKELGHNAFYMPETIKERGEFYNLYIERYSSRQEAEKEAKILEKLGLISGYTIRELREKAQPAPVPASVTIPIPKKPSHPMHKDQYYLQVGSFGEKVNADNLLKKIKKAGYDSFHRHEALKNGKKVYRVYVKGYQSRTEAQKNAKRLIKSGLISGYILKPPEARPQAPPLKKGHGKKVYFLHVSSFQEKVNAEQKVRFLKEAGLKSFFVEEKVSGKNWFRVYVGDFDNEKSARKAGEELKGKGIISYFKPLEIDRGVIK